ncbi:MAG: transposase, partial [Deltaproteobacteria bacterium]|nr:transposase [Deltaproteobacteria bacterium]
MFRTIRAGVAKTEVVEASALEVGAIVALQRFGSTLNLNPHLHLVALDGAYVVGERPATEEAPSEPLRFVSRTPPSEAELVAVSTRVAASVLRLLQRRGLLDPSDESAAAASPEGAALVVAANRARTTFARNKSGRFTIVHRTPRRGPGRTAEVMGFSTHAGVFAPAGDVVRRRAIV